MMPAINDRAKCEGIGCAYRERCGRYVRPEGDQQAWGSFYALADDDCSEFEPISKTAEVSS